MKPTLWNDQNVFFDNFENSDISQKRFCFLTNGALIPIVGKRNHWWWL
jgi:hypothetical protein